MIILRNHFQNLALVYSRYSVDKKWINRQNLVTFVANWLDHFLNTVKHCHPID